MFVWLLGLVVHLSMLVDRAAPPTFEIFFNPPAPPSRERAPLLFFPYFFTFDIFAASGVREPSNHHSQSRYKIDSLIPILEHELNTSSPFNPIHITHFLTYIPTHYIFTIWIYFILFFFILKFTYEMFGEIYDKSLGALSRVSIL